MGFKGCVEFLRGACHSCLVERVLLDITDMGSLYVMFIEACKVCFADDCFVVATISWAGAVRMFLHIRSHKAFF